jgi:hypothetical protein
LLARDAELNLVVAVCSGTLQAAAAAVSTLNVFSS